MKGWLAAILLLLVTGGLMIYSASRTVNLLQMTLPEGQKDLAFLALLAFDGGVVAWLLVFMFGASGGAQRAIAGLLTVVSLIGVVVGFGADQVLGAQLGGVVRASDIPPGFGLTVVLATVGIIAAHIAATVFFHLLSPGNRRRMQEEGFNDRIEQAAMHKSEEAIEHLAADLSERITAARMARLTAVFESRIVEDEARDVKRLSAADRKNGHKPELLTFKAEAVVPKVSTGKHKARG